MKKLKNEKEDITTRKISIKMDSSWLHLDIVTTRTINSKSKFLATDQEMQNFLITVQ